MVALLPEDSALTDDLTMSEDDAGEDAEITDEENEM